VFQKYWQHLDDPLSHPDCNETEFIKDAMREMSNALSGMDLSNFEIFADVEASQKACRLSHVAAVSRRCLIQDAIDYWTGQEGADTGSGPSAPS
jgi:hypothetical protein